MIYERQASSGLQMDFAPLFSGSSGNATYVCMDNTHILVDAGLSGARIGKELDKLNVNPETLDALLVTHEHADHICAVGILSRRYDLPVYATEGTWAGMSDKIGKIDPRNRRVVCPGQDFYISNVDVTPFSIPHDASEPVGYTFSAQGLKAAIATDLGHISENWLRQLEKCDLILLEANHDVNMLKAGRYPYELKRRILGSRGHLSNDEAGRAAVTLSKRGVKRIVLGHLSKDNNFPELAYQTVAQQLQDAGVSLDHLEVARRDCLTAMYHLSVEEEHA